MSAERLTDKLPGYDIRLEYGSVEHDISAAENRVRRILNPERNFGPEDQAKKAGETLIHYVSKAFMDGHHANLAHTVSLDLASFLEEIEKQPELAVSFIKGVRQELVNRGLLPTSEDL